MKKNTWTNKQINQYSNETDQLNIKMHKQVEKHICGILKITFLNLQLHLDKESNRSIRNFSLKPLWLPHSAKRTTTLKVQLWSIPLYTHLIKKLGI